MKRLTNAPIILLALLALAGCDSIPFINSTPDYKNASGAKPLEVPPDLTTGNASDLYAVPGGSTSYSAYSQGQAPQELATAQKVIPNPNGVKMMKAGTQRWLIVATTPDKAWPVIRDFWTDMGFAVRVDSPSTGIMETEWIEATSIKKDDSASSYKDKFDKWLDTLSGTSDRKKFRTRMEEGTQSGTIEIYISHRTVASAPDNGKNIVHTNMGDIDTGYRKDTGNATSAAPSAEEEAYDAEVLRRMMIKMGVDVNTAKQITANPVTEKHAEIIRDASNGTTLMLNDGFDRGWRRVGLALDRVGFVIDDKNRTQGTFFVHYSDIDVAAPSATKEKGWFDKLKFWNSDDSVAPTAAEEKNAKKQYIVKINEAQNGSQVSIINKDGSLNSTATANKVIAMLYEQLK